MQNDFADGNSLESINTRFAEQTEIVAIHSENNDMFTAQRLKADDETAVLEATDRLTFPDVLPGFEVVVGRLFE